MNIFVTRKIPEPGLKLLRKHHRISINPEDRVLQKQEIIDNLPKKEGLLCLLTDNIDKDVISSSPDLKMIANYAVGYDNIDVSTATERGIPVSNTPDVLTDSTAEMAWALLFSASRRIVEGDRITRGGEFHGWDPNLLLGHDVTSKTLGVVGAGRIGTAFALKSKGFDMKVLYSDEHRNEHLEKKLGARKVALEELLNKSDFISIHVSLSESTRHLIGENEFKLMKDTAVLINTSRGPVIDEKSLVKALKEKWIFAAGLDVYENEPLINKKLIKLKNVVLQPHAASATFNTRTKMAIIAAENLLAGLRGEIPPNCVNPEVFDNKTKKY